MSSRFLILSGGCRPLASGASLAGASAALLGATLCGSALAGGIADECGDAVAIFDGNTAFSTLGATTSGPALPVECDRGFGLAFVNDIWFTYQATATGVLTVFTCNQADFDTRLAAYDACGGTLLSCNDDGLGCSGFTSTMEVPVSINDIVKIRLGGFSGSGSGTVTLSYEGIVVDCPPSDHDCCTTGGAGCDDLDCCIAVCQVDGFCCLTAWDIVCVGEANSLCGLECSLCPPSDHDCYSTGAPGCSDEDCCNAVCAADSFCCQVAWDGICVGGAFSICGVPPCEFTCPGGASQEAEACGDDTNGGCNVPIKGDSNCCVASGGLGCDDPDCQLAVCSVDSFCCAVAWDGICAAEALSLCPELCALGKPSFEPIACGDTVCGTAWADGNLRDTDWYELVIGPDPVEVTFTITNTLPMVIGIVDTGGIPDCNLATALDPFAVAAFCGTATFTECLTAGTYWLFAAPNAFAGWPCGSSNDYSVTVGCVTGCKPPGPDNDECVDAIEIFDGNTPFSTIDANNSPPALDPSCDRGFGTAFVRDIWYTYTATESGIVTVSTCGAANFDTRLALYSGDCDTLLIEACNDDGPGCAGLTSLMEALVTEGETYIIRVGGFSGEGTGTISIFYGALVVPNDDCADAIAIGDGVTAFSTVGATTDGPELPLECDKGFGTGFVDDVWYLYEATCTGTVFVSTCDSASFDTRLAAYTGECDALDIVGCNDDGLGCTGFTSVLEFAAECGNTYRIRVGGFAVSGSGTLTISCDGTCASPCPTDLNRDGVTDSADLGLLLVQYGGDGTADFNNDGIVDSADLGLLLVAYGPCI